MEFKPESVIIIDNDRYNGDKYYCYGTVGDPTLFHDTTTGEVLKIGDCVRVTWNRNTFNSVIVTKGGTAFVMGLAASGPDYFTEITKLEYDPKIFKEYNFKCVSTDENMTKPKKPAFKVGDRVCIKKDETKHIYAIHDIDAKIANGTYIYSLIGTLCVYQEEDLEFVSKGEPPITIEFDNNKIIAKRDNRTVSVTVDNSTKNTEQQEIFNAIKKLYVPFPQVGDMYYQVIVNGSGVGVKRCMYNNSSQDYCIKTLGNIYETVEEAVEVADGIRKLFKSYKKRSAF